MKRPRVKPGAVGGSDGGWDREGSATGEDAVGFLEGFLGPDVIPDAGDIPGEDGLAWVEPLDEATGLVGVVAFGDILLDEGEGPAWVEVEGDADEGGDGLGRFLHETDDASGGVDIDDSVFAGLIDGTDVVGAEDDLVLGEAEGAEGFEGLAEEIVPGDDDDVVVELFAVEDEFEVTDGTEFVGVVGGSVIDDGEFDGGFGGAVLVGPGLEVGGEAVVGDDDDAIDAGDGGEVVEDVIHHGFAGDGEEGFGLGEGEGMEPGGVAGGEDDDFHRWARRYSGIGG